MNRNSENRIKPFAVNSLIGIHTDFEYLNWIALHELQMKASYSKKKSNEFAVGIFGVMLLQQNILLCGSITNAQFSADSEQFEWNNNEL